MGIEVYAFSEGLISYSVTAGAYSDAEYVQGVQVNLTRGYINRATLNGEYRNIVTGQRADVSIQAHYSPHLLAPSFIQIPQSAINLLLTTRYPAGNETSTITLYSGVIDSIALQGAAGGIYNYTLAYHANQWEFYTDNANPYFP